MALAYPEGECFFNRSGLRAPRPSGYDANNPDHFNSHMMIEYVWNKPAQRWSVPLGFPERTGLEVDRGRTNLAWVSTRVTNPGYGNYRDLPISYGPSESQIRRRLHHNLCLNTADFNRYLSGGAAEVWFMTMPLPTPAERWVWIDMFAWIRAIYLPIAYHADENHQPLSTWVQINFALNRTINIWNGRTLTNNTQLFYTTSTYGLPVTSNRTLGVDVHGLMNLLCIPRQLRRDNAYGLRLLKVIDRTHVTTVPLSTNYNADYDISWLTVSRANFGLDLQWKPAPKESNWFWEWFGRLATHLIGFIPVIGPFLAIGFPIGWALITDPDNVYQIFKETFPLVDLTDHMVRQLSDSAKETTKYLPDGWDEMTLPQARSSNRLIESNPKSLEDIGTSAAFIIAEEILRKSATNKLREPPVEQDDWVETVSQAPIEENDGEITATDTAVEKKDGINPETDAPAEKKDGVNPEIDTAAEEKDGANTETDARAEKKDGATTEIDTAVETNDGTIPENNTTAEKKNDINTETDPATEKDDPPVQTPAYPAETSGPSDVKNVSQEDKNLDPDDLPKDSGDESKKIEKIIQDDKSVEAVGIIIPLTSAQNKPDFDDPPKDSENQSERDKEVTQNEKSVEAVGIVVPPTSAQNKPDSDDLPKDSEDQSERDKEVTQDDKSTEAIGIIAPLPSAQNKPDFDDPPKDSENQSERDKEVPQNDKSVEAISAVAAPSSDQKDQPHPEGNADQPPLEEKNADQPLLEEKNTSQPPLE